MKHQSNRSAVTTRPGFSMIECVAIVLVLSMIGMTVGPTLQSVRSNARGSASAANLQRIGQAAGSYGFFNNGRMFSYSWRAYELYLMPDGKRRLRSSDQEASALQNQEILQRRTGRISGDNFIRNFSARIPQKRFNHLILIDFLDESLETTKYIDPADALALSWHANPLEFLEEDNTLPYGSDIDADGYEPEGDWGTFAIQQRWAFASTYQTVPSSWQFDFPLPRYRPVESTPHLFNSGNSINLHTGRNITEVAFPSQKVWIFEEFDRDQASSPYFAYDHARTEKLMFDGSVNSWASGDANPSVVPEEGLRPWKQTYVPLHQFPLPMGGLGDTTLISQRFRWTFRGLAGVDYGPAQPNTGPRTKNP
ncbi:MAG: hypothetical protein JKX70_02050 [Phycisphaerales bacterium]|nr:hypothetical protein [Phycisphaerales bacterium]